MFYRRTHHCGELSKKYLGKTVTLSGWIHRRRDHGGLVFIDLRDRYGITQLVFDPNIDKDAHHQAEVLRAEWVISIEGIVILRDENMINTKLPTGEIEVQVLTLKILSPAKTPPFSISDEHISVNEELRLKYRYLDIRRGGLAQNLILRHQVMMEIRQYLDGENFIEVSTPILGKSTPEGARDYLVPSRVNPGSFYALPQSPQIFKQLLMVSGMDRYFQIAPCFRDEDLRADRQPEFTQIDVEMSFGIPQDLMSIMENLVSSIFKKFKNVSLELPFRRLSYKSCIEDYGCDRPDLRFEMRLFNLTDLAAQSSFTVFQDQIKNQGIVKGICVKGGSDLTRKEIEEYTEFVSRFEIKGLAWMKVQDQRLQSNITKFFSEDLLLSLKERAQAEEGDLIFMVAETPSKTHQALDHLRRKIAKDRNLIHPESYEFAWVTEFPLFAWNEQENKMVSEHHPFTSPLEEDLLLLKTNPLQVRSSGYDLILNGYEVGGGSQRIHDQDLQKKIFELLLLSPDDLKQKFGFFLEALSYGTPPHLGIALGLDRLMMILTQTENIREVIAFPKTQKASDLMMECPSEVHPQQLKDLKLQTTPQL